MSKKIKTAWLVFLSALVLGLILLSFGAYKPSIPLVVLGLVCMIGGRFAYFVLGSGRCPGCGKRYAGGILKCCPFCGEKIDWDPKGKGKDNKQ